MGLITILYVMMAALSATIAGIYLAAWLMQREALSYLIFVLLAVSIAALAATELWMLRAQTPEEYATALRWFHVPIWSGFIALVALVHLRLRPRFSWVGWLAAGLRTVSLVANFVTGPNLNYVAPTNIDYFTLLGEPVAIATGGVPNPWMLTGQASLVLSILFLLDGGISAWRRGDGMRSLVLTICLFFAVAVGTVQAVLVFWGLAQLPLLITPLFLFVALVMGSELSFGLLRAARAERDVRMKEAALGLSEQRLSLAAEAADAGFWSLDAQSGGVWATDKTRELFGLPADGDLRLSDFLERVHRRDRTRLEQLIQTALQSNDRYRAEFRTIVPGGGVRWLGGLGRSVEGDSGGKMLMGVIMDVTARRAMVDEIRRQRERLDLVSRAETLSELSVFLAHELNQPLTMILTNAEAAQAMLARASPNLDEVNEILADIVKADRRAADVIRHIRGLFDRGEPRRDALSLDAAIQDVLRLVGSEIDEQGVKVDLNLASDLPRVRADRVLIEQALLNLLTNACEALAANPAGERRVSMVTRAQEDAVLVEVTDNGPGLADQERVFDPLYSTKPGGLGMGLTIVRSIVGSHGGRVWARPAPGRGATVAFTLPLDGAAS